jgi:hypothetical protein
MGGIMPRLHKDAICAAVSWMMAFVALVTAFYSVAEMFRSPVSKPWVPQQEEPAISAAVSPVQSVFPKTSERIPSEMGDRALTSSKTAPVSSPAQSQVSVVDQSQIPVAGQSQTPPVNWNENPGVPFRGPVSLHPNHVVPDNNKASAYPPPDF